MLFSQAMPMGTSVAVTGGLHRLNLVTQVFDAEVKPSKRAASGLPVEHWKTGNKQRAARKASNVVLKLERAEEMERREIYRTSIRLYPPALLAALDDQISRQNWQSALKTFELLRRQEWYEADSDTFVKLVTMLGKCKRPDLTEVLVQKMMEDNCPPTVELYTALASCYVRCNLLDKAFLVFEEMKKQRDCAPDCWTYSLLIRACCEVNMFDRVQQLLAEMNSSGVQPSTVTYNSVINEYGKFGLFEPMEQMFEDMGKMQGCQPDIWTWNSILKCYGNRGRIEHMEQWFYKLCTSGVQPDSITFNTLIKSYGRVGAFEKMSAVVDYMYKYMYPVDIVTYNLVINAYGKAGHISGMEEAFKQMKWRGIKPNSVTFCSLVSVYGKATDGLEMVEKVFRQIRNSDVRPDVALYNSLMDAYQRSGDLGAMEAIFEEMKRKRCRPDSVTYHIMIDAYRRKMMHQTADELQREMADSLKSDFEFV